MKKFEIFLLIIAVSLVAVGYYFSKEFASEKDIELRTKNNSEVQSFSSRVPNFEKRDQKSADQEENKIPEAQNSAQMYIKTYLNLKNCIQTQNCDFPQDDPRQYEIEVHKAIDKHLNGIEILSTEMKERVLYSAVKLPDGFIKETVLKKLIEDKIYSPNWRNIILDEVISQHNSRLIPDAIEYFKSFSNESDRQVIHSRIFKELATGSPKVAQALAENLKLLLDKESLNYYKDKISNLEEGPIKTNLTRQLTDFEMKESAG